MDNTVQKKYCFIHSCRFNNSINILNNILLKVVHSKINFEIIFILNIGKPILFEELVACCLKDIDQSSFIDQQPLSLDNIKIINYSEDTSLYELETLKYIHLFSINNPNCDILYLHTKGVSYNDKVESMQALILDWTNMMLYFLLNADCLKDNVRSSFLDLRSLINTEKQFPLTQQPLSKTSTGSDVIGCNYSKLPYPHFSGNFWWAKSNYISTLNTSSLKIKHDAEWWILSNTNNFYSLHDSNINHYKNRYLPEKYKDNQHLKAAAGQDRGTNSTNSTISAAVGQDTHCLSDNRQQFIFYPNLDYFGNDLYFRPKVLTELLQIANNDVNCVAFNTLGFFKHTIDINKLETSCYFKSGDGLYVKADCLKNYER